MLNKVLILTSQGVTALSPSKHDIIRSTSIFGKAPIKSPRASVFQPSSIVHYNIAKFKKINRTKNVYSMYNDKRQGFFETHVQVYLLQNKSFDVYRAHSDQVSAEFSLTRV